MKFYVFDGTPEEFTEVAPMMGLQPKDAPKPQQERAVPEEPADEDGGLTVDQIKRVLTRRRLDQSMTVMLGKLYKAGNKRISSSAIKEVLGMEGPNFRGMLGAFGRRLANTPGIPKGVKLLNETWDFDLREKTWTLSSNARKALEELKLV